MRRIRIMLKGKQIGEIVDDCYVTHREVSEHFYIKGGGYPISNNALKVCKEKGVTTAQVIEHGAKGTNIYDCTLQKYLDAVLIKEGNFDAQRCVPLKEMNKL